MDVILAVNAGSSSLKFQVFRIAPEGLALHVRGAVDGIGTRPRFHAKDASGAMLVDERYAAADLADLPAAVAKARQWLGALGGVRLRAIGHRVVHGGPNHAHPVLIDEAVLAELATYQDLAPLHQPNNLAPIRLVMEIDPAVPQVACFDTAFHRDHPPQADTYAIPRWLHEEGVRRYGFHGLSYEYVAGRLLEIEPQVARGRTIVAHLGSGASMCALLDGHSIESTMGFTALDGLPMGTRPGQLDPGVVLYLIEKRGFGAAEISKLLYHEAGLKGLSGLSNDMRDLLASDDPAAAFAVEHFVYRAGLAAGTLAAALKGLDAVVFTAGIGENAPIVRALIAERLRWLGAALDPTANEAGEVVISAPYSRVRLLVVPTNEELMIARHTLALVAELATT